MRVMARGERSRPLLNNEFDGDMCSATAVLTDDGIDEIPVVALAHDADRLGHAKPGTVDVDVHDAGPLIVIQVTKYRPPAS